MPFLIGTALGGRNQLLTCTKILCLFIGRSVFCHLYTVLPLKRFGDSRSFKGGRGFALTGDVYTSHLPLILYI